MQVSRNLFGKSRDMDCNDAIRWMSFFFDPIFSSYNEDRYFPWILDLKYHDLLIKPTQAIDFIYTGFEDRIIIWYKEKPFKFWKRCKAHEIVYYGVMSLMEDE